MDRRFLSCRTVFLLPFSSLILCHQSQLHLHQNAIKYFNQVYTNMEKKYQLCKIDTHTMTHTNKPVMKELTFPLTFTILRVAIKTRQLKDSRFLPCGKFLLGYFVTRFSYTCNKYNESLIRYIFTQANERATFMTRWTHTMLVMQ